MAAPYPQRLITITVNGNDKNSTVFYTYTSPLDGLVRVDSPVCDLLCNAPVNCLYVLDYISTQNGWIITETTPNGTPALDQYPGAKQQSIMTVNPYNSPGVFKYFIHYRNELTGATISIDPQEGNVPR